MKVSVLVAVYNAEQYLDKCLNSLLSQTLGDIEVVCVDDASTDSSLQILRRYEAGDSRIKVVALEHNTGLAHARNVALREAEGEYICMLDADDWYSDDALEKAATILDNNADIDCVLFRLCYYCDDKRQDFFAMKEFTTMTGTEAMKHSIEWDGVHGIYMIRAEIHHRFPYDETTRVYSDENTARLHFAAARNVGLCDGIYYYRQHEKSVTHDVNSSYTDRIMATQSLLTSLIGTGIDKETEQRLYDKLWLTVVDGLYFVYNNRKRLSANDRKECMDKIVKAWQATDPKKISDTLKSKFGYMPMKQSWMLFLAEERLYFFLKKLKG